MPGMWGACGKSGSLAVVVSVNVGRVSVMRHRGNHNDNEVPTCEIHPF